MSFDNFEARKKAELEALKPIKNSFFLLGLIYLAMLIVVGIQVISTVASTLLSEGFTGENFPIIGVISSAVVYSLDALFLFIFLLTLNRGIEGLGIHIPQVKITRLGIIITAIGTVVIVPFQVALLAFPIGFNIPMIIVSISISLIVLVGLILILIGIWRIGEHYKVSDVKLGVILLIFLSFIGAFYLYSSFDKVMEKVKKRLPPPPVPPWI